MIDFCNTKLLSQLSSYCIELMFFVVVVVCLFVVIVSNMTEHTERGVFTTIFKHRGKSTKNDAHLKCSMESLIWLFTIVTQARLQAKHRLDALDFHLSHVYGCFSLCL